MTIQQSYDPARVALDAAQRELVGEPLPPVRIGRRVRIITWTASIVWMLCVGSIALLVVLDDPGFVAWLYAATCTFLPPVVWHAIIQARVSGRMLGVWAQQRGVRYARKATQAELPVWAEGDWLVPGDSRSYRNVSSWTARGRELLLTQLSWRVQPKANHGPYLVAACRVGSGLRVRIEERSRTNRIIGMVGRDDAPAGMAEWSSGVPAFDERLRVRAHGGDDATHRGLLTTRTATALSATDGIEADLTRGLLVVRRAWRSQLDPAVVDELVTVLLLLAEDLDADR
ncbi:MAG: hypothetical protein JWM25_229 [Thermoleophilia bacterium]|nr:hypothetical protein [Thermoleophilia bacterium]MCZ4495646.1 hypothetical protein [Thermoleophilia bacterium]